MVFANRVDAGRRLGKIFKARQLESVIVVGLPRGGVLVAFEVAREIGAPLDVIIVRKLGIPFQPEVAMGAIGEGGVRVIDHEVVASAHVSESDLVEVERMERAELERRVALFRRGRPPLPLFEKTVIVVDDGIATGSTARAACLVALENGAAHVILAVPVAPRAVVRELSKIATEVVCLETPEVFVAVGKWYADFNQTQDEQVIEILGRSAEAPFRSGEVATKSGTC